MASILISEKLEATKFYLASSIVTAKEDLRAAQHLGTAAVEEWLTGLDARGKDLRSDASRWERWAATGGLALINQPIRRQPNHELNGPVHAVLVRASPGTSKSVAGQESQEDKSLSPTSIALDHQLDSPANANRASKHQEHRERDHEEAAALKALRRAEIERRAMQIEPPLPPNLLGHMSCFQTAIKTTAPLDDIEWGTLLPKLLAERTGAERSKNKSLPISPIASPETNHESLKKVTDKDWDDIQGPVRTQISKYADDIVRSSWGKGRKVKKENSPRFAAEVLLSVRARFYAAVAQDAAVAIAADQQPVVDPPEGPFTQKLTLENMKWVFDTKIKPHTESYRKELFLCNGCDSNRFYGFEGVIQHYAAKHTKVLSLGNVVVHWRAEWPEQSPFRPNARPTKHDQATPSNVPPSHASPVQAQYGAYDTLHHGGNMHHAPPFNFPLGQLAPTPSYPPQYTGTYPPPHSYTEGNFVSFAPYLGSGYGANGGPQTYVTAPTGFGLHPGLPGPLEYPPSIPGPLYPGQPHHADSMQNNNQPQSVAAKGTPFPSFYYAQMETVARSARDTWNALSSVRDLPGPLRVYVVIYHVVKRFRLRFSEAPSLRIFNDGLSNNKEMRPVRNVNGLMCKSCTLGLGPSVNSDRKTFSLPQLVKHFENCHLEFPKVSGWGQPSLDWTQDMVLLPEVSEMPDLRGLFGHKGHKFNLVNEAAPWFFTKLSEPSRQPQNAWPLGVSDPDAPHHPVDNARRPRPLQPNGRGNKCSDWRDSTFTRDPSNVRQAEVSQKRPSSFGFNDCTTAVHGPFFDPQRARETRPQFDPPVSDTHWSDAWNSPSRSNNQPYESVHHGGGYLEITDTPRHYVSPTHGTDRTNLVKTGRRHSRERSQAPGLSLAESISEQDAGCHASEERFFHVSDQIASVGPRLARERTQPMPRDTQLRRAPRAATIFRPTSAGPPPPKEPDEFTLTAALESYLARGHDVPTQMYNDGLMTCDPGIEMRRDAAHESYQPTYRAQQQEHVEVVDHARQGRSNRQSREPYLLHLPGDSYEAAYTQCPPADQLSGHAGGRRKAVYLYANELRNSPVQYEEAYEIVLMRDTEGEYVVRRPILRDREPPHILYEEDRRVHLDQEAYPPSYGSVYESTPREGNLGGRPAPASMRQASLRTGDNLPLYEEYDPSVPAPMPSSSEARGFGH